MNIVCTICSDLIIQAENIHVTKCGHVFHYHCLTQWLERSKTCPQCRNKVTKQCMFRVYPTVTEDNNSSPNAATLQSQLDNVKLELRQQKSRIKEKDDLIATCKENLKKQEDMSNVYQAKLLCRDAKLRALEDHIAYTDIQLKETQKLKDENEALKKNMQTLNGLQKVLNATVDEVQAMLQSYTEIGTIAVFATALKRALCESEAKKNECRDRLHIAKQQLALKTKSETDLQNKIVLLEEDIKESKATIQQLQERLKAPTNNNTHTVKIDVHTENIPRRKRSLNSAVLESDSNCSFNTLVNNIENSDSPYLNLKQAGMFNLAALQRTGPIQTPENNVTLDEVYLRNCVKNTPKQKGIFYKKETLKINNSFCTNIPVGLSYDGMGGHSKPDDFPVPQKYKSCVPKLTAKHKLKRPLPTGSQDIKGMLKKIRDK